MARWLKRIGLVLAGIVGLLVLALVVSSSSSSAASLTARSAGSSRPPSAGRRCCSGPVDIGFGWQPGLTIGPLTIANPPGIEGDPFLHLPRAEAAISLADLVRGRIVIPRLIVTEPRARLVRLADGRTNWEFGTARAAARPARQRAPAAAADRPRGAARGQVVLEDAIERPEPRGHARCRDDPRERPLEDPRRPWRCRALARMPPRPRPRIWKASSTIPPHRRTASSSRSRRRASAPTGSSPSPARRPRASCPASRSTSRLPATPRPGGCGSSMPGSARRA